MSLFPSTVFEHMSTSLPRVPNSGSTQYHINLDTWNHFPPSLCAHNLITRGAHISANALGFPALVSPRCLQRTRRELGGFSVPRLGALYLWGGSPVSSDDGLSKRGYSAFYVPSLARYVKANWALVILVGTSSH